MIQLGSTREKIAVKRHVRCHWPKWKHQKRKPKKLDAGTRLYYEQQLQKAQAINRQLQEQFCVERELNNQMYQLGEKMDQDLSRLVRRLLKVQSLLTEWNAGDATEGGQAPVSRADDYLQMLSSIALS